MPFLASLTHLAGGLVGYWVAKDRYASEEDKRHGFGHRWHERHPRWHQQQAVNAPLEKQPTEEAADFAAFQAWKQQHGQQSDKSAFQADFKTAAMENADKALDSVLAQVQTLKSVSRNSHATKQAEICLALGGTPSGLGRSFIPGN